MFTILRYVGQVPWETESEILRSACASFMEDALRPSVRGKKEVRNRTEWQEKPKDNAATWNQWVHEGALELGGPPTLSWSLGFVPQINQASAIATPGRVYALSRRLPSAEPSSGTELG